MNVSSKMMLALMFSLFTLPSVSTAEDQEQSLSNVSPEDNVVINGKKIIIIRASDPQKRVINQKFVQPKVHLNKAEERHTATTWIAVNKAAKVTKPVVATPKTHRVTRGPIKVESVLSGLFESKKVAEISLRPKAWTSLSVLSAAAQGSSVKRGDVLIQFDTKSIDKAIVASQQDVYKQMLAIKKTTELLKIAEKTGPVKLAAAQRAAKQSAEDLQRYLKIGHPLAEKSALRNLKSYERSLENAQEELHQLEKMYKEDDLTEETEEIILKRQRYAVESATNSLSRAKIRLEQTLKVTLPRQMATAKEATRAVEILYYQAKISLPYEAAVARIGLKELQNTLTKAQEKLGKLQLDRKTMTVRSPTDGLVFYGRSLRGKWSGQEAAEKKLRKSGTMTAGEVIMAVVSPKDLQVRVTISEKEFGKITTGLAAKITPTAYPQSKLSGKMKSISAIAISTTGYDGTCAVKVPVDGPNIVPGMTCKVTVRSYYRADAITVPTKAVVRVDAHHAYVNILKNGKKEKRWVVTGKSSGSKVEITSGLKVGEVVSLE